MSRQDLLALVAAVALAAVHILGGRLRLLDAVPRSGWLSAFGGVSVAYVFVHLLPELAEGQKAIDDEGGLLTFLEDHVYLMGLLGLAVFYGVESHCMRSRRLRREAGGEDRTGGDAFGLSIASFAVHNAIVGYLLMRDELDEPSALALYAFALGVHFVINDVALREHHRDAYRRVGRWVIAGAVLLGWAIGAATTVPERAIALVLAFIGGGVVLNVLKEELPGERQARPLPFAAGAGLYALLLQLG